MRFHAPRDPQPPAPDSKRWRPLAPGERVVMHVSPPLPRPRWWGWQLWREFYLHLGLLVFLFAPLIAVVLLLVWWLS